MKKKVLALALGVGLIAIAVGGTLAWFTDTSDPVKNVFTIGEIKVEIDEDWTQPDAMLPVIDETDVENDKNFIDKDVRVENTGKNDAYVQLYIAVPQALDDAGAFHLVDSTDIDVYWTKANNGKPVGTTTVKKTSVTGVAVEIVYNVYKYVYNSVLEAPVDGQISVTEDSITGAYLDSALDYNKDTGKFVIGGAEIEYDLVNNSVDVLVVAQAVQAEGFDVGTDPATVLEEVFGSAIPSFT